MRVTGEQLAGLFWNMSAEGQAEFFNTLGNIPITDFISQMRCVADSDELLPEGSAVMESIGEYSDPMPDTEPN